RDIEQRNNDGNGADDLPDIRQVVEIHVSDPLAVVGQAFRLPNQKAASPSRTGIMRLPYNSSLAFELTFVFRAVVVTFDSAMASIVLDPKDTAGFGGAHMRPLGRFAVRLQRMGSS